MLATLPLTARAGVTYYYNEATFLADSVFGLNITDWGDFGNGVLTFSNNLGKTFEIDVTPNSNGNQQFFGVISDGAFTTVTFT